MKVTRYDGTTVDCFHDGSPCPGCTVPREDWPAIWRAGLTLVRETPEGDE